MRKLVLFMHVTLDGYVAGPNGEMDWIHIDEALFDYAGQRTAEADTALYSRVTYEMMQGYWPTAGEQPGATKHDKEHSEWYNRVAKIVLSRTMSSQLPPKTKVISQQVDQEIKKLKEQPGKDIVIFGSPTAVHALMQHNLVDDFWLMINPVLLGKGIPLFKDVPGRVNLKLESADTMNMGVVCAHYTLQV